MPLRRGLTTETVATPQHFWTSGRVTLFTAFTASLAYVLGASEMGSFTKKELAADVPVSLRHQYGSKADMEKVECFPDMTDKVN